MSTDWIEVSEKEDAEFWIGLARIAEHLLNVKFCFTVRIRHTLAKMSSSVIIMGEGLKFLNIFGKNRSAKNVEKVFKKAKMFKNV